MQRISLVVVFTLLLAFTSAVAVQNTNTTNPNKGTTNAAPAKKRGPIFREA